MFIPRLANPANTAAGQPLLFSPGGLGGSVTKKTTEVLVLVDGVHVSSSDSVVLFVAVVVFSVHEIDMTACGQEAHAKLSEREQSSGEIRKGTCSMVDNVRVISSAKEAVSVSNIWYVAVVFKFTHTSPAESIDNGVAQSQTRGRDMVCHGCDGCVAGCPQCTWPLCYSLVHRLGSHRRHHRLALGEISAAVDHACVCPGSLFQEAANRRGRRWRTGRWLYWWREVSQAPTWWAWWRCWWREVTQAPTRWTWWRCWWREVTQALVEGFIHELLDGDNIRGIQAIDTHVNDNIANGHGVVVQASRGVHAARERGKHGRSRARA